MLVVSNTSPLSNLAIIGRLALVFEQLGVISVPPAVSKELEHLPHASGQTALSGARRDGLLGILIRAKFEGRIPSIRPETMNLRSKAHFFIGRNLERDALAAAGE